MKKFIAAVIAFFVLANVGFGVFLEPLLYTLTPLQRYYLGSYFLSSLKAGDAAATSQVRWLWKVRPEAEAVARHGGKKGIPQFQYAFATEQDVVPVPAGDLFWRSDRVPFTLSPKAELEGWSAVVWRNPVEMNSGQLSDGLRQNFFDGEPVWRFFLQPFLVLVLGLLLVWIVMRERAGYYRRQGWSGVPYWRYFARQSLESGQHFQKRLEVRRAPLALPAAPPARVIEATPVRLQPLQAEVLSQPASQMQTVPPAPSKPPVQPVVWDESKGLE